MDGFTYNGVHTDDMKCVFIPDPEDRWFKSPDFTVFDENVNWYDGGYYYGNHTKPREFVLDCYYEEITRAEREAIRRWLDKDTYGRLVFDERPFCYYDVRPTKVVTGKEYSGTNACHENRLYSGTFTVTFTAYKPYGKMFLTSYDDDDMGASDYCGILQQDLMPDSPTTASRQFLLYNPGTEPCDLIIEIAGTAASGLNIRNDTNNTECKLLGLPTGGNVLKIDGSIGYMSVGGEKAFEYHDIGYVALSPYGNIWRGVHASGTASTVTLSGMKTTPDMAGKYIYMDGEWLRINTVTSDTTLNVAKTFTGTVTEENGIITGMNDIRVYGDGAITLTTLNIDYTPTVV